MKRRKNDSSLQNNGMRSISVGSDFHDKFTISAFRNKLHRYKARRKSPGVPKFLKPDAGLQLRVVRFLGYLIDGVIIGSHVHVVRVGAWLTFATGTTHRRFARLRSATTIVRRLELVPSRSSRFLPRGVAFQQFLHRLVASGGRQVAHVRHALADLHEQTRHGRCTLPRAERARGMIGLRATFRIRKVDALQAVFAGRRVVTMIGWGIVLCLGLLVDHARLLRHADARVTRFYVARTAAIVEATVLRGFEAVVLPLLVRVAVVAPHLHDVGLAVSATVLERATEVRRLPDNGSLAPARF